MLLKLAPDVCCGLLGLTAFYSINLPHPPPLEPEESLRSLARVVALGLHIFSLCVILKLKIGDPIMKMMSVIAVTPKEGASDEITDLIVQSRADGVDGLDVYSIVHTREDQLLVVNEWESIDAFMEYVNGPHNMIELIEHLCERFDEENVCKAYSGMIMHQENSA